MAIVLKRSSNSGLTRVANCRVRPVRRALRPSCFPSYCVRRGDAGLDGIAEPMTDAVGAVSGASRLVLASVMGGGAPSEPLRFSLLVSAIGLHLINEVLDERVGLGVQSGVAGLGDGMPDVLGFAVSGTLKQTPRQHRVTRFSEIGTGFRLLRCRSYAVKGEGQF